MPNQIEQLPEGFWIVFGVNYWFIKIFTEASAGMIAALASVGEILLAFTVSVEGMLNALVARIGIKTGKESS